MNQFCREPSPFPAPEEVSGAYLAVLRTNSTVECLNESFGHPSQFAIAVLGRLAAKSELTEKVNIEELRTKYDETFQSIGLRLDTEPEIIETGNIIVEIPKTHPVGVEILSPRLYAGYIKYAGRSGDMYEAPALFNLAKKVLDDIAEKVADKESAEISIKHSGDDNNVDALEEIDVDTIEELEKGIAKQLGDFKILEPAYRNEYLCFLPSYRYLAQCLLNSPR